MMPESENRDFGFYGTVRSAGHDPDEAWTIALPIIASFWPTAHRRVAEKRARIFLDCPGGRHLADAVLHRNDLASAIRDVLPSFYSWMS